MKYTFSKAERLSSIKHINQLFEKGSEKTQSVFLYPFRVVYHSETENETDLIAILISVSKRSFKKAVDRNTIKRRIKEAYRLNKAILYESENKSPLNIAFIYVGKEILPFVNIENKLKVVLHKIVRQINLNIEIVK